MKYSAKKDTNVTIVKLIDIGWNTTHESKHNRILS